jgi:3-methyladenine DNA glycosylase AlkD
MTRLDREALRGLARRIEADLRASGDPERRDFTSGYFPTRLEILGVKAAIAHKIIRECHKELRHRPGRSIVDLAQELVRGKTHEGRGVGHGLLSKREDALRLLNEKTLLRMGKGNDNWASVDGFAVFVTGQVWRRGGVSDETVLGWAGSEDLWWRRTALVSTVPLNMKSRGGTGDPERTLLVCRRLARDREPMVAKGLSWALRALIAHDRAGVQGFLEEHGEELPSLVRREVRNKLTTGRKTPVRGRTPLSQHPSSEG